MRTSRELVLDTLEFKNAGDRVPRELWVLPWAEMHHPQALRHILGSFAWDFGGPPVELAERPKTEGDPYAVGESVDEWGCRFVNIQAGVIGEVKDPPVTAEDWSGWEDSVHIPDELLSFDADAVNRYCAGTDLFVKAGCCPRPFERLQFVRGTEAAYMDLMDPPPKMLDFLDRMHRHDCALLEKWAKTDVDALTWMDDWGSQTALLINPRLWVELFKPMYRDFIDIAKAYGKKTFMHSDGYTLDIIPHLIEIGLDAFNTQIFCMGVEKLAPFKGKLTFWGEIDRQNLLPHATLAQIDAAVDSVYDTLWQNGGCIAQCEFGPMGNPDNVFQVYRRWQQRGG